MCGIFGGFGINKDEVKSGINLINRGEDGISIKNFDNGVIFAARRHLVKKSGDDDNKKSDQPYYSEDKKISLIFNGEFYNFNDYKRSLSKENIDFKSFGDTEVFLKLYEKKV